MGAAAGLETAGFLAFIGHVIFTSLPNILTIFVAISLFGSLYPLREKPAQRLAATGAACLGLSTASALIHYLVRPAIVAAMGPAAGYAPSPLFFVLVLAACVPLCHLVFDVGRWDALFCCAAGYTLQNFAHAVHELAITLAPAAGTLGAAASAALQLGISAAVFAAGWQMFIKNIRVNHLQGTGDWRAALVLAAVIAVNIVLDVSIRSLHELGAVNAQGFLVMRLLQLFASALTLALGYQILYSNRMRTNAAATRQMLDDQRRQYELSAETIEAINLRCHDIRHQVRALGAAEGGGPGASQEFLDGLSSLINVYDAGIKTGNKALDVILTEKSMLCQGKGIGLTCVASGEDLGFMAAHDIYSLFGNALDNAIEAADAVTDPARRLIDVSTRTTGQMVCVQVRNYFDGAREVRADGTLATTKTDGGLHGYGTKSMRLIATRYGGSISSVAEDGLFRLTVLLPIPT